MPRPVFGDEGDQLTSTKREATHAVIDGSITAGQSSGDAGSATNGSMFKMRRTRPAPTKARVWR